MHMVLLMNKIPSGTIIVTDLGVYLAAKLPNQEPDRALTAAEVIRNHAHSGLATTVRLSTPTTGTRGIDTPQQIVDAARFWSEATGLLIYDMRRNRTIAISDPAVLG